jgi:signal recognition particle subunit SEC65
MSKPTQQEDQKQKWLLLYPLYLDKTISRNKGRQVKNKLAIPNLKLVEITNILEEINIPFKLEETEVHKNDPKRPGRVKFSLTDSDGAKVDDKIPNSKIFFRAFLGIFKIFSSFQDF